MTQLKRTLWFGVFAAALVLLPCRLAAQSGTVTDDGFISTNSTTQLLNLNGQGISLIVAGSSAAVGSVPVGTTKTFIKFQLPSSLPPGTTAANAVKATLKLYLSPLTKPSGAIDIYPVTSAWSESTLNPSSPPTLAATAFATAVPVGQANSFLVVDLTQLVQEWLNGPANGGLANDGIALVADTSTSYVVFDSKESIVTSHEPRLEIVLANSGPQGAVGPQGPQGPQGAQGPQGQQGSAGSPGTAATIKVEAPVVAPAGTLPSVLNGGTPSAADLTFILPQGAVGPQGPAGPVLPDLVYTDKDNTLMSNQTLAGNLALAPTGAATPSQGYASNPLDLAASVSDGTTAHNETFRWQSVPLNNGSANFGAQLSLLYGGGTTPSPTGFSANPDGSLNFVSNQVFTGKHIGDGSGLTNLPSTFTAGGDLTGSPTSQTVSKLQGFQLSLNGTGPPPAGSVLGFSGLTLTSVPGFVPGGDLSGTPSSQTVSKLQGFPLSLAGTGPPPAGSVLGFSGINLTLVPGFSAGGDLAGSTTSQTVTKLQGVPLAAGGTAGPSTGQVLGFNGTDWAPTTVPLPAGVALTTTPNNFNGTQAIANGNLALPQTTGPSVGVISINGIPFLHEYGDPSGTDTFLGNFAGGNFTNTGTGNTATGFRTLLNNTSGFSNTATGSLSLLNNGIGIDNTAVGANALMGNTAGNSNVGLGVGAGSNNVDGSSNTLVGSGANTGSPSLTNATAIGANAFVNESNALVLGSNVNVGIGTSNPQYTLDVNGSARFAGVVTFSAGQTFPGIGTITGVTAGSGLSGGGMNGAVTLGLNNSCAIGQVLQWNGSAWVCANLTGGGTVTGVTAGLGLIGGGAGGTLTLSIDSTRVPQLAATNVFVGSNAFRTASFSGNVSIDQGMNFNGGGLKHVRFPKHLVAGTGVTLVYFWSTPFADANYTVSVTLEGGVGCGQVRSISLKSAGEIDVDIIDVCGNDDDVIANIIAIHD